MSSGFSTDVEKWWWRAAFFGWRYAGSVQFKKNAWLKWLKFK
jgi:hypothetical protein